MTSATACTAGKYSTAGNTVGCQDCPAGFRCPSAGSIPEECPKGYYSLGGGTGECIICPAGSYCPNKTSSPVSLSGKTGVYALAGSSIWTEVLPGENWVSVSEKPVKCGDATDSTAGSGGSYWDITTRTCKVCDQGYFCPSNRAQQKFQCPAGYYGPTTGLTDCIGCPAGYKCPAGAITPTACLSTEFSYAYSSICTPCPAGYSCPSPASTPVICPVGTYAAAGSGSCSPCSTAGSQCPDLNSATTTACAAGSFYVPQESGKKFSVNGQDWSLPVCRKCPAGYKCPSASSLPVPCGSGEYQDKVGQTTCVACPAGSACPYRDAAPYTCPTGYASSTDKTSCIPQSASGCNTSPTAYEFAWPNQGTCILCPEGFECLSTYAPPRKCIPGYYSLAGAQYCTRCEAGSACPSEYGGYRKAACAAGTYSLGGSLNCYPVPAKMKTSTVSAKPTWCNFLLGEYSAVNDATCTVCPADKECPYDSMAPTDCPSKTFTSRAGEYRCYPNISYGKNQVFPATPITPGMDVEVQIGKIGFRGMDNTKGNSWDCPPGYMCLTPFTQNWTQCPPGYYSPDGVWICMPCPEGSFCPLRHNTATTNNDGYWSPLGVHIPLVVPAGWKAGSTQPMQPCNPGEYSNSNSATCTKCVAGQVCPQNSNNPLNCNEGFESKNDAPQNTFGQFACVPCDKNEFYNEATKVCEPIPDGKGAIHPMFALEKCMYGLYSDNTSTTTEGKLDCQPCDEGTFCASAQISKVGVNCPNGYWCSPRDENSPQLRKYPCPAGTYAKAGTNHATQADACQTCDAGYYCNGSDTAKTDCPAGYFCPAGTKWSTQFPCLPGTKRTTIGASQPSDCVICAASEYCPLGTATPFACPPNSACTNSQAVSDPAQDQCSDGTYPVAGVCTPCPAGSFCVTGVTTPQKCPAGRKRATTGGKNRFEDCIECTAGELCPVYGMTAADAAYAPVTGSGYIFAIGTEFKQSFPCPAGTYDDGSTTPAQISHCKPCPAGYACPEGTGSNADANKMLQCEPGHYCDGGITHSRQKPCTGGTYNPERQSTSSAACLACSPGYYCPSGAYRMLKCPSGYFCGPNTEDYSKFPCPAGTYRKDQMGQSNGDCTACPAGYYCEVGSVQPVVCPVGTFRATTGAKSAYASTATSVSAADACTMCTAGNKCPFVGMTATLACPAGFYTPAGSQTCFRCRPGYRCDTSGATQMDLATYESGVSAGFNNYVVSVSGVVIYKSETCNKGYYCPEDALYEIPCPAGTVNDFTGKTALTDCVNVADKYPGYYADKPGSYWDIIKNNKCAPGYYCTGKAQSAYDKPCKTGMYNTQEAQSTCIVCPAGSYCLGGANKACAGATCTNLYPTISYWPIICPAGYFCEAGVDVPTTDANYYKNFPQPCPKGSYGGSIGLKTAAECTICDPGSYCAETGAYAPTGKCYPGFYCANIQVGANNIGSTTPQPPNSGAAIPNDYIPLDSNIGGPCPIGGYCEAGSFQAKACPGGFYHYRDNTLAYVGLKTIFDCTVCPPGSYCEGTVSATAGQGSPTDYCEAGFYCLAQSTVKDQYPAKPGYYTRKGASSPTQCEVGTYNLYWHQPDTNPDWPTVAPGSAAASPINLTDQDIFYDPLGVTQHVHCQYCREGFYCDQIGMSDNIKPCPVGKFCTQGKFYKGVSITDPTKPDWYTNPVSCLPGTYNPTPYATKIADCLPCPPGKYCAGKALDAPSGDCLAGYFCKESSQLEQPSTNDLAGKWGYCPEGSYCEVGTAYPKPCPPGTYGAKSTLPSLASCTACPAGYYCPLAGMKSTDFVSSTYQCEAGYYCASGSKNPRPAQCQAGYKCPAGSSTPTPCPAGTYQHNVQQADCITCPAGYFCYSAGPSGAIAPTICPAGSSCPEGTKTDKGVLCPLGYWQPETGRTSCFTCPTGYYCDQLGLSTPTGQCQQGFFCLTSSTSATPTISSQGGVCTDGNYCPTGSVREIPCEDGYYCTSTGNYQMTVANQCQAGYVCYQGANIATPVDLASQGGEICPAGFWCVQNTGSVILPTRCIPGTYRASTGAKLLTDCLPCPAGKYCESYATGYSYDKDGFDKKLTNPVSMTVLNCDDGYKCEISSGVGAVMSRPTGQFCPAGYKCTSGYAEACGDNYYQDRIGQNSCKPCPAGYQCPKDGNGLYSTKIICGQNFYCPNSLKDKKACTPGTYTLSYVSAQLSECQKCPAGYICSTDTSSEPAKAVFTPCPAGQYCAESTHNLLPAVQCDKGYYCPLATPVMIPCPPGYACITNGMSAPPTAADLCTAGYYCTLTSSNKTPTDGVTGNICPAGYYCPSTAAQPYPVPCPIGTYRGTTGGAALSDCTQCTSDQLCDERALKAFKATPVICATGYYCPTTGPKQPCPKGAKCPLEEDRTVFIPCPVGQYQPNMYSLTCFNCPAGKYCPENPAGSGLHPEAIICPKGYYCPTNTENYLSNPCPDSTYNPFEGGSSSSSCYHCPEGKICQGLAQTSVTGDCPVGNYCAFDQVGQQPCPAGTYCELGTSYPTNCPLGTYQPNTSQGTSTSCIPCENNKYCGERGVSSMSSAAAGNCGDGFVCIKGTSIGAMYAFPTKNQQGDFCPAGKYCTRNVDTGPQPCGVGTYNPNTGSAACVGCPMGLFCDVGSLQAPNSCPVGFYCPEYSSTQVYTKVACSAGSYSSFINIGKQDDCIPCRLGSYCSGNGAQDVTGPCDAGTYCPIGSTIQSASGLPVHVIGTTIEGPCPKGYMCPQGTDAPIPCVPGTYNPLIGQTACIPCKGGYYCDEYGMSDETFNEKDKRCDAGYYCVSGSMEPYPLGDPTGKGDQCPPGSYCPQGSAAPITCPPGTFETRYSSYQCQTCPAGYYCPGGTIEPIECDSGYCPLGSIKPTLCPDGSYADKTLKKLTNAGSCPACPNAKWCTQGIIQGFCSAGFWCNYGSASPNDPKNKCETGHFCPSGTPLPIRCPEGKYTASTGAMTIDQCIDCPPGYYCIQNDSIARPCPKGHICPAQSVTPTPCFQGTYNPKQMKSKTAECLACPNGTYCHERGIVDYNYYKCPPGHYCPDTRMIREPINCPAGSYRNATGAIDGKTECWDCPEGFFCNEGSTYPEPCDPGYTCPEKSAKEYACYPGQYCPQGSNQPIDCPAGYYCPTYRTYQYQKCANGTYCPPNSSAPLTCPAGSFGTGRTDNYDLATSCISCGRGQYSAAGSNTCEDCWAGYVCVGNAKKPNPTDLKKDGGMICPKGFYCPKKTWSAIACPLATYNDQEGAGFLNLCRSCQEGYYGDTVGAVECKKCAQGTISKAGQTSCSCQGLNRKYIASEGKCVCQTGYEPVDGSAGNDNGFTDCAQIIYERCEKNQLRDSNGFCKNITDCSSTCRGNGTISIDFGICECEYYTAIDSLCNAECQQKMPKIYFNSDGIIQMYDPLTNKTTSTGFQNTVGQTKCAKKDPTECTVTSISMINSTTGDFGANFNLPSALPGAKSTSNRLVSNLFTGQRVIIEPAKNNEDFTWSSESIAPDPAQQSIFGDQLPWRTSSPQDKGRKLNSTEPARETYIANPVICTTIGSAVLFENLSNTTYPVYLKDSLLNTNDNFDYGQFSQLPSILKNSTIKNFVFTFNDAGVYVFGDSRNKEKQTIVSVMAANGKCPSSTAFLPQTADSLLRVNAKRRDILLPPNWYFFFSVLVAFCLLILAFVATVGFVVKRDWRQKYIEPISYQKQNYQAVQRSDPEDKRAIVSINTENSSIKFKHYNQQEPEDEIMDAQFDLQALKEKTKKKKTKDLQLNQVEDLKDRLGKHAAELEKLFGRKKGMDLEHEDYLDSDESDEELEQEIDELYKLVQRHQALLKGEEVKIEEKAPDLDEKEIEIDDAEQRRQEREREEREKEEMTQKWLDDQNKNFLKDQQNAQERAEYEFQDKKNTVLEQQIKHSKEIGQTFTNQLEKYGAEGEEVKRYMDDLKNKMQHVEHLMHEDEDRQNDLLRMKMEARKARRKKLEDRLADIEDKINTHEKEKVHLQEQQLELIQQDLQKDLDAIQAEEVQLKQDIEDRLKSEKYEKLADFEDRLKATGSQKEFQKVLADYQKAQIDVDREQEKQRLKDNEKLERDLKARRAAARAKAKAKKDAEFQKIEDQIQAQVQNELQEQLEIKHALQNEDQETIGHQLADEFTAALVGINERKQEDMEKKRRQEEELRQKHHRLINNQIANDVKEEREQDKEINLEIERLARTHDPFQEKVRQRAQIMDRMTMAGSSEEVQALQKQLDALDDEVKRELNKEEKLQDDVLRRKLEDRKRKKQAALERERNKKSELLQERIDAALKNSDDFNLKKKQMTAPIINEMILNLKDRMSEAEIPAAIEKLIEENQSRELQDLLLKMYEQKCVELKEEVLNMMQEKIARQQLARKNNHDRKRGLDALISRTLDPQERIRMQKVKEQCDAELEKELVAIEKEYERLEGEITMRIQKKSLDRENERVSLLQEEQLKEKNLIFQQLLPESMLNVFLKDNADEERIELEKLRQDLEAINQARIKALEEQKANDEQTLSKDQGAVNALAEQNRKVAEELERQTRLQAEQERQKKSKISSEEIISSQLEEFKNQNNEISSLYIQEREAQMEKIRAMVQERKKQKEEEKAKLETERKQQEEQAALERKQQVERVTAERAKRDVLLKSIQSKQKLLLKECYSRPTYTFNRMLHESQVQNEEFNWINEAKTSELQRTSLDQLLQKIEKLGADVDRDLTALQKTRE